MTMTYTKRSETTSVSNTPSDEAGHDQSGRKVWIDGQYVASGQATVSVFDHGLLYGDGCFEGIRAYGGRIFKLRSHLERMYRSAEKLRLTPGYSIDEVDRAVRETVEINGLRDAYIRLVFTRGIGTLGLNPFKCPRAGTICPVCGRGWSGC